MKIKKNDVWSSKNGENDLAGFSVLIMGSLRGEGAGSEWICADSGDNAPLSAVTLGA